MTQHDPWDDARLDAAYTAYASSASPPLLAPGEIRATLERPPARGIRPRRGALAATVAVAIIVAGSVGGLALLGQQTAGGGVTFRDGPAPDLRTLDAGEFAFDYPADWLAHDSAAAFSGGSSIAVIGTQPIEPRCGTSAHVDVNCVYEQVLEPGAIRVFIGTGAYRGGTVLDRPDIENGTTTRLTVAGMPAILDEFDPRPDSYYGEDLLVHWSIGNPAALSNVVRIEAMARDPGAADARAALDAIVRSFRFTGPPASDPTPATEAYGLPVISVPEALALRDADVGDRELAVRGWFSPIGPISCPAPATWPVSPVEPNCPDDWIVLMSEPESLVTRTQDGAISEGRAPSGPAIPIDLDDLDTSWIPDLPDLGPAVPVELVVLGHFDDRRAGLCPEPVRQQCRDRMVIDRVVSVDGIQQRPAPVIGVNGVGVRQDAVGTFIEHQAPGGVILAMTAVDGETGIGRIEPSLGTGQGGFIDERAIWVVRSLEGDLVVTYLVVDESTVVHRMERDGSVTRISPEPAAETPSPDGVIVVELTSPVAAGSPPARVTVVDTIGIVGSVREVGPDDRPLRPIEDTFTRDPDVDGRYRLWWMGSICDAEITVTIATGPGITRIVIDHGTRPACDTLGVARELVLDLTRSLDTTGVELVIVPPTLTGGSDVPPADRCAVLTSPDPPVTCASAVRLGDQAGARIDRTRIWLTTLGAVRASMAPIAQVALPDDASRVWLVVLDGRWDWDSRAVDETGQAPLRSIGNGGWWSSKRTASLGAFVYLQDWTDRPVPERLAAAPPS